MSIVLNEHEWAEEMLATRSLGKKPFETLHRVARYYIDSGYQRHDARKLLDTFLLQCDPTASLPKWINTLDAAVSLASKRKAVHIESLDIRKIEMDAISSLPGRQTKRLAFTLLCLAKYWDLATGQRSHWVNSKDSDIMRMANVRTSIKRQSDMYRQMYEDGMVEFSKKIDNTNVRVCFVAEEGDVALRVTDMRNLGYQYMMYDGDQNYIRCKHCGLVIKKHIPNVNGHPQSGRPQIYCADCANEIKIQNSVTPTMAVKTR